MLKNNRVYGTKFYASHCALSHFFIFFHHLLTDMKQWVFIQLWALLNVKKYTLFEIASLHNISMNVIMNTCNFYLNYNHSFGMEIKFAKF